MKFKYIVPKTFFSSIGSLVVIFGVFVSGCKKFVEIGPPQTQLVTASVFNNGSTATSAQTNIYSQMANYGESYYMALYSGMLADELTNYSNYAFMENYYTNSMYASNTTLF